MDLTSGRSVARLSVVPPPDMKGWGDFPIEVYPLWARQWCQQLAWELQISVDAPALLLLGVMGGATGRTVQVWRNTSWVENTTTWAATVYGSGERKSACIKRFAEPNRLFEKKQQETVMERIVLWLTAYKTLEGEVRSLLTERKTLETKEAALRAHVLLEENEEKRKELNDQIETIKKRKAEVAKELGAKDAALRALEDEGMPYARRVRVNDITPVALKRFLYRNGGRGMVLDSEAAFLDNIGHYARNALTTYLAAEAGDRITLDRAKDVIELVIEDPSLSLAVMPQPDVVEGLARLRGARERGLLARLLIVFAESRMGGRNTAAEPMDAEVHARYVFNVLRLLTWTNNLNGTVDLVLSSAAQAVFAPFHAEIEARLGADSDLGDAELKAWASKLPGRALKIASHLHLMAYLAAVPDDLDVVVFGERLPLEIDRRTMEGAIRIARYLIPHAHVAFERMLGGRTLGDANRIVTWAARNTLDTFSRRDARRAFPKSIQRSPECDWRLDQALRLLLNTGSITEKEPPPPAPGTTRTGRPHSKEYIVIEQDN